jgi:hypothetical protein
MQLHKLRLCADDFLMLSAALILIGVLNSFHLLVAVRMVARQTQLLVHSVHLVQALLLQQVTQRDPGHPINGNIQMIIL